MRGLLAGWLLAGTACGVSDEGKLPPDIEDPSTLRTATGAVALYHQTFRDFALAFDGVMVASGVMTDELMALPLILGISGPVTGLDSRQTPSFRPHQLHELRAQAREAREFLRTYASDSSPALRAEMYAVEAYAEIFLADLFCSGIPLSTINFEGGYTLARGSSTEEVYRHAVAFFDTATTLASDSLRVQQLIAVGRGRALLALGQYADAAAAVTVVPDNFQYRLSFSFVTPSAATAVEPDSAKFFWFAGRPTAATRAGVPTMGDQEGGNGLNYRSSADPRTLPWTRNAADASANRMYFPRKYISGAASALPTSPVTFIVASGVEARLIEAEAALQEDDESGRWLELLNSLRQNAWPTIVPATAGPLPDLIDPGTNGPGIDPLRMDLLFRERAFWLYLTSHRMGDLRRLIRQYEREGNAVYPAGLYRGGNEGVYGEHVVLPMPEEERVLNPQYTGCIHPDA